MTQSTNSMPNNQNTKKECYKCEICCRGIHKHKEGIFPAGLYCPSHIPLETPKMNQDIREEFRKWMSSETTFALGMPDNISIADFFLSKFKQELEEIKGEIKTRKKNIKDMGDGYVSDEYNAIDAYEEILSILSTHISKIQNE